MDVFYKDYRGTTQKGEITVSKTKLQKFTELGDYYASNGGYLEKKSNAYLDDFKKNAGYNNYTRFARDVNSWGQPGCQAQPWCAEYQFWKLVKVLGITRALQIMGGGFYNCKSITNHAKSNGTWHKSPKVGALIIFRNGSHVGSVRSFNGSVVYTNEETLPVLPAWWQTAELYATNPTLSMILQLTDMFGLTGEVRGRLRLESNRHSYFHSRRLVCPRKPERICSRKNQQRKPC